MATVKDERRVYLRADQMTPEFYNNLLEGETIPHREILQYVVRKTHARMEGKPSGAILKRVNISNRKRAAAIVGFADRSIKMRSDKFREQLIEPFTMKTKYPFTVEDPEYRLDSSGRPSVDAGGAARAVASLEQGRLNRVVEAVLAMLDSRQFLYKDNNGLVIQIDYSLDIPNLTAAGAHSQSTGDFSDANTVKSVYESRAMKAEYRAQAGIDFTPRIAFINPTTAGVLMLVSGVVAKYIPLSSSDPDRIPETYDAIEFDGITYIVLHKTYPAYDANGQLVDLPAVEDGWAVLMPETDPATGEGPIEWHSVETTLNREDASGPYYDTIVEGEDPAEISPRMYDNGIPAPSRRGVIARWRMFEP